MTTFNDLPDLGNGFRMAGSQLLDEEQWNVEEWHLYRDIELRPTVQGIKRYAQLRESRKSERKTAWQTRVDAEEEYSDSIHQLIQDGQK